MVEEYIIKGVLKRVIRLNISLDGSYTVTTVNSLGEWTRSFDISLEALRFGLIRWQCGMVVQQAFPMLSDDEREWLLTGEYFDFDFDDFSEEE